MAHAGVLGHVGERDRQRAQRLRGHLPGGGHDGQLAASGSNDPAPHGHEVAEIDVGLPGVQRLLADLGQRQHRLQVRAVAVLQRGEAQLAGVAHEDEAAGDGHLDVGLLARGEVGHAVPLIDVRVLPHHLELRPQITQRDGAVDGDGVGLHAGVDELLTLLTTDAQLFGEVLGILLLGHGFQG